jgi:ferredoxin-thioredoxin reductase catalytic subunit
MQGELLMIKIAINPDENFVKEVREKIKANNGHCACAISFNDSNKCMCEEFRQQINEGVAGECHCGLYILTVE